MGLAWSKPSPPSQPTVEEKPVQQNEKTPFEPTPVPISTTSTDEPSHVPSSVYLPLATGASRSYWLQNASANPLLNHRTTKDLPAQADVVIIGSGMSGALVAYDLLHGPDPPKRVVLLEARDLCSGATGRNAGHCKPDQYRGFTGYAAKYGAVQAQKLLADEQKNFLKMADWVKREGVDCDLWVGDTFDVAVTESEAKAYRESYEAFKATGADISNLRFIDNPQEAQRVSRINGALACVSWTAGSFYPWKFVAHVIQACLDKGLNLQTHTPVESVSEAFTFPLWAVNTPRGSVVTPAVVYATNAYTSALLPMFRDIIKPTPFICSKVVPPPSHRGSQALQNTYYVSGYKGSAVSINPRSSSDGVVLFGGDSTAQGVLEKYIDEHPERRADDSLGNFQPIIDGVEDFAAQVLTGWKDAKEIGAGEVEYNWSGIIGASADGVPFVGPVPGHPGQWVLAGFTGHGMARIFTSSSGLVKLMKGESWEDTELPDPFRLTIDRLAAFTQV
ncbi:DAO-domain-containing protein [Cylindrobasidium torrendii FP15055 ss-10]|uniref:DAO-domain-containing protein n=1 Tax=Cylindrobasidium torrendii FP15055 ss-10 TaxID=1314674 RepID=A0A0D7B3A2_9AGAR|nr:DAO-domain-containing protein [Cylindrobasidium torrendii FP15055 ss-10]